MIKDQELEAKQLCLQTQKWMSKSLYMLLSQKIHLRPEKHFTMVQNDHLKGKWNKAANHKYRQND